MTAEKKYEYNVAITNNQFGGGALEQLEGDLYSYNIHELTILIQSVFLCRNYYLINYWDIHYFNYGRDHILIEISNYPLV